MAKSSRNIVHSMFLYALLTSLIITSSSRVIKRREIAATIKQQNDENETTPMTITTLKVEEIHERPQNGNGTKSTKLVAQKMDTNVGWLDSGVPITKTTLNLINETKLEGMEIGLTTEGAPNKTRQTEYPSTISSITNSIDLHPETEPGPKVEPKIVPKVSESSDSISISTEGITTTDPPLETTSSTTESILLVHKAQLSLEDSNEIHITSSSKQPKFLSYNSTNSNQLNLPNTVDVWSLAGMKSVTPRLNHSHQIDVIEEQKNTTTTTTSALLNPVKEKTLTDWTHIVQMGVDKSVGNALTEEKQHNFDNEEATPLIMITTLHAMSPSPPLTTTTTLSNSKFDETTTESTTIKSNSFEESKFPNEMTTTLTPSTAVNTEGKELLSVNDSVDSLNANNNNKQHLIGESTLLEKNEEKFMRNEENEEMISPERKSEIVMTVETTTTMKMTTISTPATALVNTTESTFNENNIEINGITIDRPSEGEKKVHSDSKDTAVINESETKESTTEFSTTISRPIEELTTTTTIGPTISATNIEEVINFSTSTTRQPPPDIYQIGTKSNLETPTTTTTTTTKATTIETTPTTTTTTTTTNIHREEEKSSAIANQTLTETKTNDNDNSSSSSSSSNSHNEIIIATNTDSLSDKSTSSVEPKFSTLPIEIITTTTTTPNSVGEATVVKDTTLESITITSTSTPSVLIIDNKTTTTTPNSSTDEPPSVTTVPSVDKPKATTRLVDIETTIKTEIFEMNNATVPTSRESTSTEAPLTNFIDDFTTTTIAPPNSTISPATISTSTATIVTPTITHTTTTPLSAETTESVDVNSVINEETTLNVESTTSTIVTTTTPTTLTELPAFIPHETTTTTKIIATTTEEMLPVTKDSNHLESQPSMPIPTTMKPITFPDNIGILRAQPPKSSPDNPETDVNVVIAISVSVIGVIALILLVAFLYLMRKRQKQTSYGQRCRPVGMDAYSLDNVSVLGSMRRKGALRASKRSYGNAAFDDPSLRHNVLQTAELAKFVERRSSIFEEFRDVPQITARPEEIPEGCENKNRYANVIPLPETRVVLSRTDDNDDTTEYINANYVRGPKDAPNYYIACQAPLESTVQDFWRMIWEQQSRVIIQATDLIENGVEKCAEYLPPSVTLDNHTTFGDFQVTLKNREVKDKYAISTVMVKHTPSNTSREITHYWYKWPEIGVPSEESPIIAMLLEARSSLKSYALEVTNELKEKSNSENENGESKNQVSTAGSSGREINGNVSEKTKIISRNQGPLTIHCSPGTGRTGTIIACDMAIRSLETTKSLDIPQIVYYIRRGRASAVQTKEQYEFIYKVSNVYAMKITNVPNDN